MLSINKNIGMLYKDKTFVLTDFDRTLTIKNSETIWGIISNNDYVDPNYKKDCLNNFDYFRPLELNYNISENEKTIYMLKWFKAHIELFKKYNISSTMLDKIILDEDKIILRHDSKLFLKNMYELNIPVVIVSSGFTYLIKEYLKKNDCLYPNIIIIANEFVFKNDLIDDVKIPYLHSSNKDKFYLGFIDKSRLKGISFGDQVEDTKVGYNLDIYKVGFLNDHEGQLNLFNNKFDITLTGETSFTDVAKLMIKEYPKK